ncbi:MAG: single-stranded-DNA-specific exonuclease RecJ, partial [Thermomicrobiales bacterium]
MTVHTPATRWILQPDPAPGELERYDGLSAVVARLLLERGIVPGDATAFLNDRASTLADPSLLAGMTEAVTRIRAAYARSEKICIYGDYDADGLTAQGLLVTAFRAWDFPDLCTYTPHREREGYGLHHDALAGLARDGVGLVIAVDCGISDAEEVARARTAGVDVIVVDHHAIPARLPAAVAVINPHLTGSAYPFRDLAGVGVSYALVRALAASGAPFARPDATTLNTLLAFVAIGTVADVVPLVGENRVLVQAGLRALRQTRHAGLLALCARAGIPVASLDAGHISYGIAPRLNAPGRMRGVEDACRLLAPASDVEARMAAVALDEANRTRQAETRRAVAEAVAMVESGRLDETDRILFLGDPSWSIGIVGLVAAKLVERYHRPALVYARGDETSRGSARSTAAFNIVAALESHAALIEHFGGHPRAAGFAVSNENIAALHAALLTRAAALSDDDFLPTLHLNGRLDHADVSLAAYAEIAALAPFGHGNVEPLFLVPRVRVGDARRVGGEGAHLSFSAGLESGESIRCIAFGSGAREAELSRMRLADLAATLQRDVWRGDERLQLRVKDF